MSSPTEAEREARRAVVRDWLSSLDAELADARPADVRDLLAQLHRRAAIAGVRVPFVRHTPAVNTLPPSEIGDYPGDPELEERLEALVRWNAMAIVMRANQATEGIGGHLGSYASAATLFEVGFHHVFRGRTHPDGADHLYLQGHASPGVYARAFLEGRLTAEQLDAFRLEVSRGGLPSYPHPWLMPTFWEVPSVSMGLAPIMAVYQARLDRYLLRRGVIEHHGRTFAIVGDGEMDEPESVGALRLAAREALSDLTLVVDCNLQRLDGPVRGAHKSIRELEALFLGAGWHVIKVLWGSGWQPLLDADTDGRLVRMLDETVDGQWQRAAAEGGAWMREHLFEAHGLGERVARLSDAELEALRRGGHDRAHVLAAYRAAEASDRPTVILAQTVKGWGLGDAGEALNVAHKTKVLDRDALRAFRDRLGVPVSDEELDEVPLLRPDPDSAERRYLAERREALGGFRPLRRVPERAVSAPDDGLFERFRDGSGDREATTTMWLVRMLSELVDDDDLGPRIVPIVPDEARTFGLEALFPKIGIYRPTGTDYEPVDADKVLSYEESSDGQILEEGITEAGAMSSFIAAGTAYAHHGTPLVPFFLFYSMFGLQRIGDLVWAAGDARARGFLIGCTSGRTTLNGEGLQHQDGHSQLIALGLPHVRAFDPAYGYEVAVIVQDGLRRLLEDGDDVLYYLTVANEPFAHPPMPDGARRGILRGCYRLRASDKDGEVRRASLLASGPLVRTALAAQRILEDDWGVTADVYSVTSYKALHDDAMDAERAAEVPYVRQCLGDDPGAVVAVSDWVKAVPGVLSRFLPDGLVALGTDGFGRSDTRTALREHFEITAAHLVRATLRALVRLERYPASRLDGLDEALGLDPDAPNPRTA